MPTVAGPEAPAGRGETQGGGRQKRKVSHEK